MLPSAMWDWDLTVGVLNDEDLTKVIGPGHAGVHPSLGLVNALITLNSINCPDICGRDKEQSWSAII